MVDNTEYLSTKQYVTMKVDTQYFGISVEKIRDILILQQVTKVPLTSSEVIGLLNLRGRIVTAIDIRPLLAMGSTYNIENSMSIVVEYYNDLYSLVVDSVGEVLTIKDSDIKENPENLSKHWQEVSYGVYPVEGHLIVILDSDKLFSMIIKND